MPRTTSEKVMAILDVDEDIDLDPFIASANALVTKCCSGYADYTTDHLELIERWLSAHFYCMIDPRARTEQAGSVQSTYEGKTDLRLQVSQYGQQAMLLDWNGGLAALNNALGTVSVPLPAGMKTTGINWLGKTKEEQDEEAE